MNMTRIRLTRWIPETLSAIAIFGMAAPAILEPRMAGSPPADDQVAAIAGPSPGAPLPPLILPLAGLGLLALVALAVGRRRRTPLRLTFCALTLCLVGIGAAWFRVPLEGHPARTLTGAGLLGLALVLLFLPEDPGARTRVFRHALVLFVFLFALGLRWGELLKANRLPLDPDAETYLRISRSMRHPFDTGAREPLVIWGFKASGWLFGSSATSLRVASVFFSLAALLAAFLLGRRLFAFRIAFLTTLFLAWWPLGRAYSTRGLRDELLAACAWFFLAALWRTAHRKEGAGAPREILVASTAVGLASVSAIPVAALLLLSAAVYRRRVPWRTFFSSVLFAGAAVAPYLLTNQLRHGDPFLSVNLFSRGFANLDFCDTPGFPTCEEVGKDLFVGERLTGARYMFGLHSPGQVIGRLARGYWRILRGYFWGVFDAPGRSQLLLYAYWLGVLALMVSHPGRYLVMATLLWLGPVAFVAGSQRFVLDWRLLSPVWVMQASALAICGLVALRKARAALARSTVPN